MSQQNSIAPYSSKAILSYLLTPIQRRRNRTPIPFLGGWIRKERQLRHSADLLPLKEYTRKTKDNTKSVERDRGRGQKQETEHKTDVSEGVGR